MNDHRTQQKQRTRDRIADVATRLFHERGFDAVTVQEVANAAGVSKVTVFAHFSRKEDLLLDLAPLAIATVVDAVRGRAPGTSAIQALRQVAGELGTDAGPLPVLGEPVVPFLRTAAAAESVLARVVHYLAVLEGELTHALAETSDEPDPALMAGLVVTAYRVVFTATASALLAGGDLGRVRAAHEHQMAAAFDRLDRVYR